MYYTRIVQLPCRCAYIPTPLGIEWICYCPAHRYHEEQLKLPFDKDMK